MPLTGSEVQVEGVVDASYGGTSLENFLVKHPFPTLSWAQRWDMLDNWVALLDGLYPHLPLKRAMYGYDPIRALEHLRTQVTGLSDDQFHRELTTLLNRLRDRHTQCTHEGWRGQIAMLPFLVEEYVDNGKRGYLVTKVARRVPTPFEAGVELRTWNGIPFDRAVELYADLELGGHPAARRARALESLTFRPLRYTLPPDGPWVHIEYTTKEGKPEAKTFYWEVIDTTSLEGESESVKTDVHLAAGLHWAINPAAEDIRRIKKLLFAPEPLDKAPYGDVFTLRTRRFGVKEVSHLRIWTFDVDDAAKFVEAVARAVAKLPKDGLIIDIRDNPGGLIAAAERLLAAFNKSGRPVTPTRFAFRATALTAAVANSGFSGFSLGQWVPSLRSASLTGEAFSSHLPVTKLDANAPKGIYAGPIVVVANANTYSAGDLFAAGMVDNAIAPLVCVGNATGGGGAEVWTGSQAISACGFANRRLQPMPADVSLTIAALRAVRSGASEGILIEDSGVAGQPYAMSRGDVTGEGENANLDLIRYCAGLLLSS